VLKVVLSDALASEAFEEALDPPDLLQGAGRHVVRDEPVVKAGNPDAPELEDETVIGPDHQRADPADSIMQ